MASYLDRKLRQAKNLGKKAGAVAIGAGVGNTALGLPGAAYGAYKGGQSGSPSNFVDDSEDFVENKFLGGDQARAAEKSAEWQERLGNRALDLNQEQFEQNRADSMPWLESGRRGLQTLEDRNNSGFYDAGTFEYDAPQYQQQEAFTLDDLYNDPGYQFRKEQGMKGIQGMAAAKGALGSGNTLKELAMFNSGLASDEANNAYSRFADNRNFNRGTFESDRGFGYNQAADQFRSKSARLSDFYNRDASMANVGQVQASNLAQLGQNYANTSGNLMTQIGNVKAAGIMGSQNARTNAINNAVQTGFQALPLLLG